MKGRPAGREQVPPRVVVMPRPLRRARKVPAAGEERNFFHNQARGSAVRQTLSVYAGYMAGMVENQHRQIRRRVRAAI